jgi:hypothetical protein
MNDRANDLERARSLGISVEELQALVGFDPLENYPEFIEAGAVGPKDTRQADDDDDVKLKENQKKKKKDKKDVKLPKDSEGQLEAGCGYKSSLHDEFDDIGDGTMVPFETNQDVKNKDAREIEHYWDRPVTTPEDHALYYGYHIHTKDNVFGLHAHYPGGPLGGGHLHGPQNKLGYHTHRYNNEELLQFKFARPGIMIQLDGPHNHQHNAPDGMHNHQEENFGPASDEHSQKVAERDAQTDKN